MQHVKEASVNFEKTIKELDEFSETWSSYLNKTIIDDTEVFKSNVIVIELKNEAKTKMNQLDSFVFNDGKIFEIDKFQTVELEVYLVS